MFIMACLLLFGCGQVSQEAVISGISDEDTFEKKITIDLIDENTVLKYSDICDSIRYVKLETRDDNLIGRIDKIIAAKDLLIVLDLAIAKRIFVFDRSGKFLNAIGEIGEGPGEYDFPSDMAYDAYHDELLVLCHNKKSIMRFKLDGTFVKEIKTDCGVAAIHVAGKDSCLLYLNNYTQKGGKINDYNILIIDENGNTISRLLPYNKDRVALSPPCKNIFYTFQNELLFSPYYYNATFKVDLDSVKIRNKYYFDFREHNIPGSLFDSSITPKEFDKAVQGNSNYAFTINFKETGSHIVNQFVYKRKIYNCIHSKESGITKFSAHFFNDINLYPTGEISHPQQGDSWIGCVEPEQFAGLQGLIKEINKTSKTPDEVKRSLVKKMKVPSSIFDSKLKDNYSQAVKSATIRIPSEEEINFINSIDETDNPIIQIITLKKF